MPFLKREQANQHCRTCLVQLKIKNKNVHGRHGRGKDEDYVSIKNNKQLEAIIKRYIDLRATDYIKDYPQHLCLPCYNKLQSFDLFCKRAQSNAEKLHEVLNGSEIKEEIEYDSDDKNLANSTNLTENLVETESVFLGKFSPVEVIEHPDPFKPELESEVLNEFIDDNDDDDDDDDNDDDAYNNDDDDDGDTSDDAYEATSMNENSSEMSCSNEENANNNNNVKNVNKSNSDKCFLKNNKKEKEIKKKETTNVEGKKRVINHLKCDQCNHRFAYKTTLDAHVRLVHDGNTKPYQCEHCDKCYGFIGDLYAHMKEAHDHKRNAFPCDVEGCNRSYTTAKGLSHHKRIKHSDGTYDDDKKFVCEQCGMVFYQSYNLKTHCRSKHPTPEELAIREENKKSFECKICKRFFHSQYTLRYHNMQQHTNDMQKYECNICGRRLAKKFMLAAHMLVHSGTKTPCEHCGRLFIRKFELKEHIRAVHLKLRPFHCRYCPESFACRKTVKHHEYIHTGEKPYVCEVCGQAYRQRSCLKNHRKTHENQVNANLAENAVNNNNNNINNNELLATTQQFVQ